MISIDASGSGSKHRLFLQEAFDIRSELLAQSLMIDTARRAGKTGVGIAGMRERVRELGGYMAIKSNSQGTQLSVLVPLMQVSNAAEDATQPDNSVPAA